MALAGAVLLGALAGCVGGQPGPATSAAASPAVPPTVSVAEFCGGSVPARLEQQVLKAPDGIALNTAWLGSGSTTAVLLHQTDGNGICGFLFYAEFLARKGIRVAVVDLCGYGQSNCTGRPLADDPVGQVKLVASAARAGGAKRVVLVGASMGGSLAVTAAQATQADAIVDLSGPAEFGSSSIAADAPNVTMPALIAFSRQDQEDLLAVRKQLPAMPTRSKVFLVLDDGHGYDLLRDLLSGELTPLASRVAAWVKSSP